MSWNASGAERVKSFRLYQELEAEYNRLVESKGDLEAEIARKNLLIRRLADALAELGGNSASRKAAEEFLAAEGATTRGATKSASSVNVAPKRAISGTMVKVAVPPNTVAVGPGIRKSTVPLAMMSPPETAKGK